MIFFKCQYLTAAKDFETLFHIWIALEIYFWTGMVHFFLYLHSFTPKNGCKVGQYFTKCSIFQITIFWTILPFFIIFYIKIEYHETFKMMMSLFWKNTCLPQKGAKRSKSGLHSWAKSNFLYLLKIGSYDFSDFLQEVRDHWGL